MPAAQQMQMQMIHSLAAVFACIDDDAIAAVQLTAARNLGCGSQQMTKQWSMFSRGLRLRGNVLFRNDKQMGRSLGIDIRKTNAEFVFVNTTRRDLSLNDFAE